MPPAPSDASFTTQPKLVALPATKAATSLVTFQLTGPVAVPVPAVLLVAPKSPPAVAHAAPVCRLLHVMLASVQVAVIGWTSYVRAEAPTLVSVSFSEAFLTHEPAGIDDRSN
jgi:hypothetical protein